MPEKSRKKSPHYVQKPAPGNKGSRDEGLPHLCAGSGIPYEDHLSASLEFKETLNIPIQYFKRMCLVPLAKEDEWLKVALNDPLNCQAADELARLLGCKGARLVLSPSREILSTINLLFDQSNDDAEKMVQDLGEYQLDDHVFAEIEEAEDLMDVSHEAPIIRLVNILLTQALKNRASDIHIEPYQKKIKVRFRVDGILHEIYDLPKRIHPHIVSRIKVMASLDIAEKRLPQDGRIKIRVADRPIDIRVSIIPMAFGERIVLRLLDKAVSLLGLGEMGLGEAELAVFQKLIHKNGGIVLVTGPTGSGKTTTLYASLNRINSEEKNIVTVEDPIEYELKGVGQIQVNPKTDLTFDKGLRSILRHDPDIIMIGEIRDVDTVEIAIQASLTGHLVFSTLHTNDAAGALTRLLDMGVEPFLISSSLLGVLAQRLVRTICSGCKELYRPEESILRAYGLTDDALLFRGKGCPACMGSGYLGRTGIFELLIIDNEMRRLITSGADSVTMKEAAVDRGMTSLFEDGLRKVKAGVTTFDEVLRVTQE
jgi:general secretion pathway protein E